VLERRRLGGLLLAVAVAAACGPFSITRDAPLPGGPPPATQTTALPVVPVGVESREYVDARRGRRLNTTLWYPAPPGTEEQTIWWDGIFPGRGAWQAPVEKRSRPFPLVLLSHGSGGDGANLAWLAEGLVAHGYIVAAVDHPGDRFGDVSARGRLAAWRRAPDVSFALTGILADHTFGPLVDRGRIAAAGHSSGGFTVLQLAGARFRPQDVLAYCRRADAGPDCSLLRDVDLNDIPDRRDATKPYRDRRVRAVMALAPVYGRGVSEKSLRQIDIPVEILAPEADELVSFKWNAARYAHLIPRARRITVPRAGHFVFMPVCSDAGRLLAAQVCVDPEAVDRGAIHVQTVERARTFFERAWEPR
jgi:predicted dienelactone hydrolase